MFYLIVAALGAALGYVAAPRIGAEPMIGAGLGLVGGLIGGALMGSLFKVLLGLIGAALGAALFLYAYREFSKR